MQSDDQIISACASMGSLVGGVLAFYSACKDGEIAESEYDRRHNPVSFITETYRIFTMFAMPAIGSVLGYVGGSMLGSAIVKWKNL